MPEREPRLKIRLNDPIRPECAQLMDVACQDVGTKTLDDIAPSVVDGSQGQSACPIHPESPEGVRQEP